MLQNLERCAVLISLMFTCAVGRAWAADEPPKETPPPRKVYTSFHIIRITNINSASETFDADFYLRLRWYDPKYSKENLLGTTIESKEWRPEVDLINATEINKDLTIGPKVVELGIVQWIGRYRGTFSATMDLRNFPFDQQELSIVIEDGERDASKLKWVLDAHNTKPVQRLDEPVQGLKERDGGLLPEEKSTIIEGLQGIKRDKKEDKEGPDKIPEWRLLDINVVHSQPAYPFLDGVEFSRFEIKFKLSRKARFYELKIILVLVLIVVMSWLTFFLKADSLVERGAACMSALLAIIGHNYVALNILPPISYLTTLDYLLLGGMGFVLFSAMESLYVYQLLQGPQRIRGQPASEIVRRIDRRCIAASPLLLMLALIACYLR
jgi:hypothetical protein